MGKKLSLRDKVFLNSLQNVMNSILAKALLLNVFCVAFAVIMGYYFVLILPLVIISWCWRSLIFEALLLNHVVENSLGMWDWFSKIDDYIYLGGIPMKSLDHLSTLTIEHNVKAVLSVMENYELMSSTLAGNPISPLEWKVFLIYQSYYD